MSGAQGKHFDIPFDEWTGGKREVPERYMGAVLCLDAQGVRVVRYFLDGAVTRESMPALFDAVSGKP